METVTIGVEPRESRGKGGARQLRAAGRVPAVVYGPKRETTLISVATVEFERKIAPLEGAHLVCLKGDGVLGEAMVLMREMQEHPVSGRVLHADFFEVDLSTKIRVTVALHFVGRAIGTVTGGILQPVLRDVEIECLPTNIPDFIEVDVTSLDIHDSLHVSDLPIPADTNITTDPAQTIVTVASPAAEAAEGAAAEEGEEAAPIAEGEAPTESTDSKSEDKSGGKGDA